MPERERRKSTRIPCEVPLALSGQRRVLRGLVSDLSLNGFRVHFAFAALGVAADAGLATVAAHLERVLPKYTTAEFAPDELGSLIRRRVQILRLSVEAGEMPAISLGCRFDRSFSDDEAAALGLPVPHQGETADASLQRPHGAPPRPRTTRLRLVQALTPDEVSRELRPTVETLTIPAPREATETIALPPDLQVLLAPSSPECDLPHHTYVRDLTRVRVTVEVRLPDAVVARDIRSLLRRVCGAVEGAWTELEFRRAHTPVWSGRARLTDAALEGETGDRLVLRFRFGSSLEPSDLERFQAL